MKAVYLTTEGDTTTELPLPLEVEGYGWVYLKLMDNLIQIKKIFIYVVTFVKNHL